MVNCVELILSCCDCGSLGLIELSWLCGIGIRKGVGFRGFGKETRRGLVMCFLWIIVSVNSL